MTRVLVVYYSRTGCTESMAREVAAGAEEEGGVVTVKAAADVDNTEMVESDAIVMGSPTYYGGAASELKRLLDESVKVHGRLAGKVGGAFSSSANLAGGNETAILSILQAMLIHGMIVEGIAHGDHYGPVAVGAMDDRAKQGCRDLGKRVVKLAARLAGQVDT